ncbi:hypothetical protein WUBG_00847 [Wuchereria bancrofti]|uniref:Uncharacterized protein n=2 Tax=Wuchereria bancrofti TaxID=6293 RepID=J9FF43_WUCBA|nr:hypothetical protein WUBG_00847 [Wuchereria bancrofti]
MEEKRIEEIKPKIMKRNAKEERIAKGKETRGKGDYPTMDDVLSDWDSERDGKKKNEDDDQKSRANTNLEDVDDIRKNEEKRKPAEDGDEEEEKKEDKGGEVCCFCISHYKKSLVVNNVFLNYFLTIEIECCERSPFCALIEDKILFA